MVRELGHSVGHLRRAAGHLAMDTAEWLTPTYERARHIADQGWSSTQDTVRPIYKQMREGAANARAAKQLGKARMKHMSKERMRQMKGKKGEHGSRWRGLSGLLIAGAAVGAASAAVARRRRAQQAEWEEYEPMTGYDESRYAESQYAQKSMGAKASSGAANMADSFASSAGRMADSLHERSANMQEQSMQGRNMDSGPGAHAAPSGMPTSANRDRLGDPALDFPDER